MTLPHRPVKPRHTVVFALAGTLVAVIAVMLLTARSLTSTDDQVQQTITRLDGAILGSCARLQGERDKVNANAATIYLVLSGAAKATDNPEIRRLYARLAMTAKYTPRTDCRKAQQDPEHYRAPRAIPFYTNPRAAQRLLQHPAP
jgi:hypothetical protein